MGTFRNICYIVRFWQDWKFLASSINSSESSLTVQLLSCVLSWKNGIQQDNQRIHSSDKIICISHTFYQNMIKTNVGKNATIFRRQRNTTIAQTNATSCQNTRPDCKKLQTDLSKLNAAICCQYRKLDKSVGVKHSFLKFRV